MSKDTVSYPCERCKASFEALPDLAGWDEPLLCDSCNSKDLMKYADRIDPALVETMKHPATGVVGVAYNGSLLGTVREVGPGRLVAQVYGRRALLDTQERANTWLVAMKLRSDERERLGA